MDLQTAVVAYGPVPSRRLGRSIGINHIPSKVCTYSCVYCQVGRTTRMPVERTSFYDPDAVVRDVEARVEMARASLQPVDYLSFVPDGEPTLDSNLGKIITRLKPLGIPIAVISNSSLIWQKEVQDELLMADWVSLKVDAVDEDVWRQVNRPHRSLSLGSILDGINTFARQFNGTLVTETLVMKGINDSNESICHVADFIAKIPPKIAYLSVPMRPPAEANVQLPDDETINQSYQIFAQQLPRVEFLTDPEGDEFYCSGDIEKDLLGTTAVHPMRHESVAVLLEKTGASWDVVDQLVARGLLAKLNYDGQVFYLRRFAK